MTTKKIFKSLLIIPFMCVLFSCDDVPLDPSILGECLSISAVDNNSSYTINSIYDEENLLVVKANLKTGKVVEVDRSFYEYEVKDSLDNIVDTSTPFGASGNYTVLVSYKEFTADPITITVSNIEQSVSVTGVSLSETALNLQEGATKTVTATVSPSNATNKSVSWSTSNATVATVSDGTITAKSAGTATITVKTVDGNKTATCSVTVTKATVNVTGVSLSETSVSLNEGASKTLTATVSPSNATNKSVSWSTSNATVATVNNGTITAKSAGNATITVKTVDGNKTATCSVTVTKATVNVTGVSLSETSVSLNEGASKTLTATVSPSNATNKSVTWSTSSATVATVSDGTITAKSAGTATITVKTVDGNKTATCSVTVTKATVNVTGVSLSETSVSLQEGATKILTATVSPSNATNKSVTWSTSSATVATVSDGTITAKSAGTATITVKTVDGNKTATCTVTVTKSSGDSTYTISFKSSSDSSTELTSDNILKNTNVISSNSLVSTMSSLTKAYEGSSGLKLGSRNSSGSITFVPVQAAQQNVKTITVKTVQYGETNSYLTATTNSVTLTSTTSVGSAYTYTFDEPSSVSSFTISLSKRGYLSEISFVCGIVEPVYPTSISVNPSTVDIAQGKTKTLDVSYSPSNTNKGKGVTWSKASGSSNVTVDNTGTVSVSSNATIGETAVIKATSTYNSLLTSSCTVTVTETTKDAWTVMIYMCGADLESKSSLASSDIKEILSVANQPDDVNILIQTGGSSINNTYFSKTGLKRYHVENNSMKLDETVTKANMGNSSTFASFLNWGLTSYPAEKTGVIMWNHGGAMQGVCFDELYSDDGLSNSEVKTSLSSLKLSSKLEFIGYDACLMQVQDVAEFNSSYFNYMIASEESESGYGWDYDTWVDDLYAKKSTTEILKAVCDGFIADNDSYYGNDQTLSVLDLSKMSDYRNAFENLASALSPKIQSGGKSSFRTLMKSVKYYGGDDYSYFCIFDVKDFLNKLKSNSTFNPGDSYITTCLTAFNNLVIYNKIGDDAGNSYGLALFYSISSNCSKGTYYTSSETNFTNWRTLVSTYGS